jgi:hypothetical protein
MTHFSTQNSPSDVAVQQSLTLIPCHTLEDFPSFLDEGDARSLLAAWTTPWHPVLIATTGRLPSWHRADSIPEPLAGQLVFLSSAASVKVPSGFADAVQAAEGCVVVRGSDRNEFLKQCEAALPGIRLDSVSEVADESRTVTSNDFYALGYAWLQVQLMTRRLRYTSNLDEIYFAGRVVEAARKMVEGDGSATIAALHEAYDAIAEERDHYFSTDPHLIDLTLLATSTLGDSLRAALHQSQLANEPPINVLIDCDLADSLARSSEPAVKMLRDLIDAEQIGVAGGGISSLHPVHHQSAASVRQTISAAKRQTDQAIGRRCEVFARAAGPTPGDLGTIIANEGYLGAIPIDFASGEGWSSESKLIWRSSAESLDVLVSKPIDGSRSESFLSLGVRLGQAIDNGEVATALVAHWPGTDCDAYRDLRLATTWGLALGKFWKIDDFFRDGQRPYHHYRGRADDGATQWLTAVSQANTTEPLRKAAQAYREVIANEAARSIMTLADLVNPQTASPSRAPARGIAALDENPRSLTPSNPLVHDAGEQFCGRMSAPLCSAQNSGGSCLIINPHSSATRIAVRMDAYPATHEAVFGASAGIDGRFDVTVDVPAHGFVTLQPAATKPKKRWFAGLRKIATDSLLVNEFMQVEISAQSGGIKGVYSGATRGNRFSLRLVHVNDDAPDDDRVTEMLGSSTRILRSDESLGIIETDGVLANKATKAIADFTIRYLLSRGSRWLWVEADIKPAASTILGENAWRSYYAFRTAVATEAATILAPLRDKLHRTEGKRYDSPAGLLIDETNRQTLLFNDGRPAFRQRSDRYIDSLLLVRNEALRPLRFAVGFDVPSPVNALRSLIAPPAVIACDAPSSTPASGWLVHCSSTEVVIVDLKTESCDPLVISFLAIATRNETRKTKLRCCREIVLAQRESKVRSTSDSDSDSDGKGQVPSLVTWETIEHSGDVIELSLAGHEVVRIRVELSIN